MIQDPSSGANSGAASSTGPISRRGNLTNAALTTDVTRVEEVLFELRRVIVGQDHLLERLLVAILARGHVLLEGVPGLAKTLTVKSLSTVVGGTFGRVQFTPDLVPSDLIGTRIYNNKTAEFTTEPGPIFVNLLLADEINRAPAKVQSALLEVMQERQVTIGKTTYVLPQPFLVLATQNPIESDGTYPLPEAQLDRFLFKIIVSYPSYEDEITVIERATGPSIRLKQLLSVDDMVRLQDVVDQIYVDPRVMQYAAMLVLATRKPAEHKLKQFESAIQFGGSPRASISLITAARSLAFLRGRAYAMPKDVIDVLPDVLRHRLVLSYDGIADGVTPDAIVQAIIKQYPPFRLDMGDRTRAA